jgi:glycosyltransferase involved in cell wall biosynthesis
LALASALEAALQMDGAAREALAQKAIAHVASHFRKERLCDKTLDIYEEVLHDHWRGVRTAADAEGTA